MEVLKLFSVFIFLISKLGYTITFNNELNTRSELDIVNKTLCNEEKCIMKCCPLGKYFNLIKIKNKRFKRRICDDFDKTPRNLTSFLDVFIKYPEISKLNWTLKAGIYEANNTFKRMGVSVPDWFNVYLNERPEVLLELPNAYHRWTKVPNDMFCWEYMINTTGNGVDPEIYVVFPTDSAAPRRTNTALVTVAMLVSCFFLLIVLVVYGLLPELRNLCGQILMAYVASLLAAFLLLAVMRVRQHNVWVCRGLSAMIYYCFMASFCWMHVMSYDIWWTFRGYAKARPIHRRGEHFKFLMYCLYAFGLPLAMTIALGVLNEVDMSSIPWFVTPKIPKNGCFLENGEKFLYLNIPMLILILCNWVFYLMTAHNVWRLSRGTAVLDSAAAGTPHSHRTHRNRLMVYLKLSAVMGLNWILEVMSSMYPGYKVWFITDLYNILIGVTVFLIFVCKKTILKKLLKRFIRFDTEWRLGQKNSMKSISSGSDGSSTQETQTLQVCANPKGPGNRMKPV